MEYQDLDKRRQYIRYSILNKVIAASDDGIGRIVDISAGGFAAEFSPEAFMCRGAELVSIFSDFGGYYISGLRCKIAWKREEMFPDNSPSKLIIGSEFQGLALSKQEKLRELIQNHIRVPEA